MSNEGQVAGTLYIVAAPSGAGKTSLLRHLVECTADVAVSISHTTRPPRPGERPGVHYHFVDEAGFRELIAQEAFLEHAQVFDHWYGTTQPAVEAQLRSGVDVILEIDWQGARQVRSRMPECCSIFIVPPSLDTLRGRLISRGEDSPEVVERRMRDAVSELSHYDEFDYLVVNDEFDLALAALRAIFIANRQRRRVQMVRQRELLRNLLS